MVSVLLQASDSLYPLPTSHHSGLIAVATFGFLSFITTTTLFAYLTVKLIRWHFTDASPRENGHHAATTDLSLGLSQIHFGVKQTTVTRTVATDARANTDTAGRHLNQFLLLVYNLLFAEMQQSMAFLLNVSWASSNGVFVGTSTCWAQGWFISTGDLAASCFITAIAIHTYLTVVRGYQPPQWLLYLTIGGLWFFIYALAIVGVVLTNNGRDAGGLYVRAVAWCWMNVRYENLRLWLHYIWIFVSLALTSGLYILIFFSLRRQDNPIRFSRDGRAVTAIASGAESEQVAGTHPGFLIYPVIYGFCTAPLALFRVATMSGREVSVELFCFAGSMIASNGWLDVVLFSWTRSSIIFAPSPGSADTGLSTFAFMRTPPTRRYGNMIWVQGGSRADRDTGERRQNRGGWWKIGSDREHQTSRGGGSQRWPGALSSVSQESLRGAGINEIQMDTVTSVIVEVDPSNKEPALSVGSLDKEASESDCRKMQGMA